MGSGGFLFLFAFSPRKSVERQRYALSHKLKKADPVFRYKIQDTGG
jgi:hypothetical protein